MLSAKEKIIHEQGLVAALKTLHDELDRAALDAYGRSDLAPLTEDAIAARFQGRGPWKKRLPQIIDTLIAVGRVRPVEGGKGYVLQ